jgi:hypothetical protein
MLVQHLRHPSIARAASSRADDSGECIKLIRKLRWIGLDDEADRLQQALRELAPEECEVVLADPHGTD